MIDIRLIRENPKLVEKGAKDKGVNVDVKDILDVDEVYRKLSIEIQKLNEGRNKWSDLKSPNLPHSLKKGEEKIRDKVRKVRNEINNKEKELKIIKEKRGKLLFQIPNIPAKDVKVGKDEDNNEVIRKYKESTKFSFTPKDHLELGESLDIIDIKRAAKVSGTRFAYLKNQGALLEFALVQYAFAILTKEGFTPIVPPVLINQEITEDLGYWHHGGNEEYYIVGEPAEKKNFYLVGTAEHSIIPMHKDEVLNMKDLPKRYVGFSTSFRREAGSYGKDTRGILRVHQFDKVEMVSFTTAENDDKEHEYLLSLQEKLFQSLGIPYQIVKMCTGDLGFPTSRKYDLEAWIPSQKTYREVTSASTTTDFQSRRLNIKYQDNNGKKYVHVLNGTAFAIGRTIIAILENYQQKDGSVLIPKVLQGYTNFAKISLKSS